MRNVYILNLYNLLFRIVAHGLLPIIPIIGLSSGMSKSEAGIYNGLLFCGLVFGTWGSGKLLHKFNFPRIIIIVTSVFICFFLYLHKFVTDSWQLYILTVTMWLLFGIQVNLINIMLGSLNAENAGKIFGSLNITNIMGTILGGIFIGFLTSKFDYNYMFYVLSLFFALPTLISVLIKERVIAQKPLNIESPDSDKYSMYGYIYFFMAVFCVSIVLFMLRFGVSLSMDSHGFTVSELSYNTTIGTILSAPFPYFFGQLMDRNKQRNIFILSYLMGILGIIFLFIANTSPLFILSIMFLSILSYADDTLCGAHISKLRNVNKTKFFSRYGIFLWTGGIVGYMITGILLDFIGLRLTLGFGSLLVVLALVLIVVYFKKLKLEEHV